MQPTGTRHQIAVFQVRGGIDRGNMSNRYIPSTVHWRSSITMQFEAFARTDLPLSAIHRNNKPGVLIRAIAQRCVYSTSK